MPGGRPTRPLPSLRFRRLRALALLVALITIPALGVHLFKTGRADASAPAPVTAQQPQVSQSQAPPSPPPEPPTLASAAAGVAQAVDQRNAGVRGNLSIAITDLSTGITATSGPQGHVFATASIVKVDILATLLLQREGKLTKSQQAVARRMIEQSNNAAATSLWRQIGGAAGLNKANKQFGLTSTVAGLRGTWGATTTTATDQLQLLRVVFTDQSPLPAASRKYLTSLMGNVASDQDWGIPAADTRAGKQFYVKNGWLPRSGGWVVNSIGSVKHSGHVLLMATLSDRRRTRDVGIEVAELVAQDAAAAVTGA
jgi:beta-lactamase class A